MNYKLISPINDKYQPIEQILINRGIKYEDIYHYLNTDSDYDILSPLLIARIEEAAKLLIKHISLGSKIFIQVD